MGGAPPGPGHPGPPSPRTLVWLWKIGAGQRAARALGQAHRYPVSDDERSCGCIFFFVSIYVHSANNAGESAACSLSVVADKAPLIIGGASWRPGGCRGNPSSIDVTCRLLVVS